MFERFSDQARQAVDSAPLFARELGHRAVGSEHLLLSLLELGDGNATRALEQLGIDRELAASQVQALAGPGPGAPGGRIPHDARLKTVLELSLREALTMRHQYIGAEHILLAMLRKESGIPHQVLTGLGADPRVARQIVAGLVEDAGPPAVADQERSRPARRFARRRPSS
jgi:ATP-dependent Clp protease ATP-binding subunit ClpA